jgi:hypothetical protein
MSRERPLMLSESFDQEKGTSLTNYSLLSKGRIRSISFGSGFHRKEILYMAVSLPISYLRSLPLLPMKSFNNVKNLLVIKE